MRHIMLPLSISLPLLVICLWPTGTQAQATRTWVSGVGDDANPCSRTAPCKTFAGAISKTAAGGEIDALDPGGYGTVTITKSILIDGTHGAGFGSILSSGVNGVNVNDSATGTPNTIVVRLHSLSINGAGTTLGGIARRQGVFALQPAKAELAPPLPLGAHSPGRQDQDRNCDGSGAQHQRSRAGDVARESIV